METQSALLLRSRLHVVSEQSDFQSASKQNRVHNGLAVLLHTHAGFSRASELLFKADGQCSSNIRHVMTRESVQGSGFFTRRISPCQSVPI